MPPKRSTHTVASPPPLIPEPRAAFVQASSALVDIHRHDFTTQPEAFKPIGQRAAVVALFLLVDSCYRDRKHDPVALSILEWTYTRLVQLEAFCPFEPGDVHHAVSDAMSARSVKSLAHSTRQLIVDFLLGESLDDYTLSGKLARVVYPLSIVQSWGANFETQKLAVNLGLASLKAAAQFITEAVEGNGDKLLAERAHFYSTIDHAEPLSPAAANIFVDELSKAIVKFEPGAKLHLVNGHAAGSAGSLGLNVVLGVPVLPVDSAKFLTSILDNLATKNAMQPSRWSAELSYLRTDPSVTEGMFAGADVFSIAGWARGFMQRFDTNLIVVLTANVGAARLVWSSPLLWLDSFAAALLKVSGCTLSAGGLGPATGAAPPSAATEQDIFELAEVPFLPASARRCSFPSSLAISHNGDSVSISNYAVGGPVFSPTDSSHAVILEPSAGVDLLGRSLPPTKRAPTAGDTSSPVKPKARTATVSTSRLAYYELRDPNAVSKYGRPTAFLSSPSASTSSRKPSSAKNLGVGSPPVRSASPLNPTAPTFKPTLAPGTTSTTSRTVSGLPPPRAPPPSSSTSIQTSTVAGLGLVNKSVVEKGPSSSSSKPGASSSASLARKRGDLELGCVGIRAPVGEYYICYLLATIQAISHTLGARFVPTWSLEQPHAEAEPLSHQLLVALRDILLRLGSGDIGGSVDAATVVTALRAAGSTPEYFNSAREHDVYELLVSAILPALERCAGRMPDKRLEMAGVENTKLKCTMCEAAPTVVPTPFTSLPVIVPDDAGDTVALPALLHDYCAPQILDNLTCDSCGAFESKAKTITFSDLPTALILILLRFRHDSSARRATKLDTLVDYPLDIDLEDVEKGPVRYKLCAVVLHHGKSPDTGHYTTAARGIMTDTWFSYNGTDVRPVPPDQVFCSRDAYVLFYEAVLSSP